MDKLTVDIIALVIFAFLTIFIIFSLGFLCGLQINRLFVNKKNQAKSKFDNYQPVKNQNIKVANKNIKQEDINQENINQEMLIEWLYGQK